MANRLALETSPYLLQHAENPVDWLPWSAAALERARREDKPILLSIGYSACHWCHVMAHESFEDEETAALMNRLFVNIKLDREERPDLDRIYQTAHQLFTGRPGGWPLTAFLTPGEHLPIAVGTYFPKEPRYGMPSFRTVLNQIEAYYRQYPDEISSRGAALRDAFAEMARTDAGAELDAAPLGMAEERLASAFDAKHGGFGGAPKFPHAPSLEWLLERAQVVDAASRPRLERMVTHTLTRMAHRGLRDHLGGGFFRYSVDERWSIPHFEKMLYDNAALLSLYADAHAAFGEAFFAATATQTAEWMLREMRSPDGGFYSTLDADAAGREGGFYVFTPAEVDAALTPEEAAVARSRWGLDEAPNFVDPHGGEPAWHLQRRGDDLTAAEVDRALLEQARGTLLAARERRPRPGRDEKILAGWNGLAIRGLARAAKHLDRDDLAKAAARAADFLHERMWREGRLLATYKDGRARFAAYLDDYAFVADGLLELLEVRWRTRDLEFAMALADVLLERFEDRDGGGFFFTADDHERLLHRPKAFSDDAVASGNGVACRVMLTLGRLLGETRYLAAAQRALSAAYPSMAAYPDAHATMLGALTRALEPPEIIVARAPSAAATARLRAAAARGYHPLRTALVIPNDARGLPGLLGERRGGAEPVAYPCRGTVCTAPITGEQAVIETLASAKSV